jgi:hypothetical protein
MTDNKREFPVTENTKSKTSESAKLARRNSIKFFRIFLVTAWLPFSSVTIIQVVAKAKSMDGFFAYCTSNLDTTGECTNEEDSRKFSCLIVPGQIISCPTNTSRSMECVWISGATANQAQFWCDRDDEAALYGSVLESPLPQALDDATPDRFDKRNNPGLPEDNIFQNSF